MLPSTRLAEEWRVELEEILAMDFEELPILDGHGDFHANQFRVHFRVPAIRENPWEHIHGMVSEFIDEFHQIFSGTSKNTIKNAASVRRTNRAHHGSPALRFEIDMRMEALDFDLPDVHSDWIGICWQSPTKGFAGQTLKRKFSESGDLIMFSALTLLVGPVAAASLVELNKYHFLAGRRSWVIGVVDETLPGWREAARNKQEQAASGASHRFIHDKRPIFFLDTAAIERYSSLAYSLMEYDPGVLMKLRETIHRIWITLLLNYVTHKRFEVVPSTPASWQQDDGDKLWQRSPAGSIYYRQHSYSTKEDCLGPSWMKSMITMHPSLGTQLLSSDLPQGGGGSFGGGGASGSY